LNEIDRGVLTTMRECPLVNVSRATISKSAIKILAAKKLCHSLKSK